MDEMKGALLRMIRAGMQALKLKKAYKEVGLNDNPLFGIYGNIYDAICKLIGEEDVDYGDSVTYVALTTPYLTEERRLELLMAQYRKNRVEKTGDETQKPKKNLSEQEFREMVKANGGYCPSTGYVPPKETAEGEWE